jgi:hypothetical protein
MAQTVFVPAASRIILACLDKRAPQPSFRVVRPYRLGYEKVIRKRAGPRHAMTAGHQMLHERIGLASLIFIQTAVCCVSLTCVVYLNPVYHIQFDPSRLLFPIATVAAFASIGVLFAFAEFSFGYFVGFYFFGMVAGYLWANFFSGFYYNHRLSGLSAAASAIAFLLPALFITSPVRQVWVMSPRMFDRLLTLILALALITVASAASYNFRFVSVKDIYNFRGEINFPLALNYLVTITSSALLPFAFACYAMRKDRWRAGAVLLLLIFY